MRERDSETAAAAQRPRSLFALMTIASFFAIGCVSAKGSDLNDYPTSARADYVFGCMKANGETQEILQKCSCSIDVIASIIPYDRYVTAETILSMSQVTGPVGSEFRSTEPARLALQEFRRAQAEAENRCFLPDRNAGPFSKAKSPCSREKFPSEQISNV